ncbi:MAG: DNA/RNA non-specific endonuclease [Prevotella sp.]|nr:DNA/RNA non-specific endonuclease [Prevotella sp.]
MKKCYWIIACVGILLMACKGNENPKGLPESFYTQSTDTNDGGKAKAKKVKTTNNNPMEQPAKMKGVPEVILKRTGYIVSYNTQTKIPNWVAWHLTAEHTSGGVERHSEVFHEDSDAPSPRVTDADYFNSGFDRGHMCPAGDNKWDRKAMNETFLFTNVCPQVHALNEGAWNDLEVACRRWARKYGDIYIVCGPLLSDGQHRTIGRQKVVVPERFFKVILCLQDGPKAIGFIYENSSHNSRSMFKNATNVDEIEQLTGIDFFPNLRDEIENRIEAIRGYF